MLVRTFLIFFGVHAAATVVAGLLALVDVRLPLHTLSVVSLIVLSVMWPAHQIRVCGTPPNAKVIIGTLLCASIAVTVSHYLGFLGWYMSHYGTSHVVIFGSDNPFDCHPGILNSKDLPVAHLLAVVKLATVAICYVLAGLIVRDKIPRQGKQ